MYDNFKIWLTQDVNGERFDDAKVVCESCLAVLYSDMGDQSDPQNRIVNVEVEVEHVNEVCDYAAGDKPEGCDDREETLDGRPVGHSTGNPACPALYGGTCHIPAHNTSEED
jgi:hypothetical protein